MSVEDRNSKVRSNNLCLNCFSPGHRVADCRSRYSCKSCGSRHHSLLHKQKTSPQSTSTEQPEAAPQRTLVALGVSRTLTPDDTPLSPTCQVLVEGPNGVVKARALLDSGAHISLATTRLANRLHLPRQKRLTSLSGVGGAHTMDSRQTATFRLISPIDPNDTLPVTAALLKEVVPDTPLVNTDVIFNEASFRSLSPADPDVGTAEKIDLLLGTGVRPWISLNGLVCNKDKTISAHQTVYGWAFEGSLPGEQCKSEPFLALHVVPNHVVEVKQFWELEEPPPASKLSPDEEKAVEHFSTTHTHQSDGRYVVALPRKNNFQLGSSREQALRRYLSTERTLKRKGVWDDYSNNIQEYFQLGHAEAVPPEDLTRPENQCFYMPMHGVHKVSSTTTKLRVVCDASAMTTNGKSLNDNLLPGPCTYPLISDIIIRFRQHRIALTGDISKMFREIGLAKPDRNLHRFLWRPHEDQPLQEARMTRVTFGVTSSPFLATQVLRQVATDYQHEFPEASKVILSSFYVDDCLAGTETVEEAVNLRQQLNELLSRAKFTLRKWRSSSAAVLDTIPKSLRESETTQSLPSGQHKALGIHWDTGQDTFHVATPALQNSLIITKRTIASEVAKVYDILGLFSPTILQAKLLLQCLWLIQAGWDDPVKNSLAEEWLQWRAELATLTNHSIPRCYKTPGKQVLETEIHGFADASTAAYAAVIYIRILYTDASVSVSLVYSRTKVAPLKPVTIPKLELSAALLLSQCIDYVCSLLELTLDKVYAWSDSTIALGWLQTPPHRLQTFMANRVSKAVEVVPPGRWRHVPSQDNPADLASRGVLPSQLLQSTIWWSGPPWLQKSPVYWPERALNIPSNLPGLKSKMIMSVASREDCSRRYSSYSKLLRVTSWITRFTDNCKKDMSCRELSNHLTAEELTRAESKLVKLHQEQHFCDEIQLLRKGSLVSKCSAIKCLNPALDIENGILCVGGRLANTIWPNSKKHPRILHGTCHFTRLLIRELHCKHQHAGPTVLLGLLSTQWYITSARRIVRDVFRACVTCKRQHAKAIQQSMGQLPAHRATPSPVFSHVGIDFAGPITTKLGRTRKPVRIKSYVAVFVCFATKATHLELVSDLSTEAFLATLKRFVSRRGLPSVIHSDNGSNFLGASKELVHAYKLLEDSTTQEKVARYLTDKRITWKHIHSRSPNFGGLWEATVKSFKTLFKKAVGSLILNFEEATTILTQTEAILNSRPLCPIDTLPDDGVDVLTPGHFLIGRPLTALPPLNTTTGKSTSLRRWNHLQKVNDEFWVRWSGEYINHLNKTRKWLTPGRNLCAGDIVICKELPEIRPRTWPLARVTRTFPGTDDRVRVVELLCSGKLYRRPASKVILLVPALEDGSAQILSRSVAEKVEGNGGPPALD